MFVNFGSQFQQQPQMTTFAQGEEGGVGGGVTTQAVGEEGGGGMMTSQAVGEEGGGGGTSAAVFEEGGGGATTFAMGEEGGGGVTTQAVGEEGGGGATTFAMGEEGGGVGGGGVTTQAVGEEGGGVGGGGVTTLAVGEEGGGGASTRAMGEEGGGVGGPVTTQAVGEEGGGTTQSTLFTNDLIGSIGRADTDWDGVVSAQEAQAHVAKTEAEQKRLNDIRNIQADPKLDAQKKFVAEELNRAKFLQGNFNTLAQADAANSTTISQGDLVKVASKDGDWRTISTTDVPPPVQQPPVNNYPPQQFQIFQQMIDLLTQMLKMLGMR